MQKGVFTISLDFELFWGVRDHRSLADYGASISKVHEIIPRLLTLFEKYGVHCTWATVGFLFHENKAALLSAMPTLLPEYVKKEYDPYGYIRENELAEEFHFAPDLIRSIAGCPGQEIATHTYSHFYTLEKNTDANQFRADIKMAKEVASQKGYSLQSIVFPRNQYGEEHIAICRELGVKVYRGNESSVVYKPLSRADEHLARRAIRLVDAYLNLTGYHCHPFPGKEGIVNIPASRFLRPYHPRFKWLDHLKFKRIRKSLQYAAANGLIFHLWWHPHNFGNHTEENFQFLERILQVYKKLQDDRTMESLTLNEIYDRSSGQ
ncbi:MAG: polysaccharide deacetylase family protein [Terrimonas sp.]|nr:polysaccharide deacetylase family protein [Terrimonas sp.]